MIEKDPCNVHEKPKISSKHKTYKILLISILKIPQNASETSPFPPQKRLKSNGGGAAEGES